MRLWPVRNTSRGIFSLVVNDVPDSVVRPRAAGDLELELPFRVGEHHEPALGLGDVERRIHHQRQHLVEHAARAERAQAVEDRGHLPQVGDVGRGVEESRGLGAVGGEHQLDGVGAAEPDAIAVLEHALGDLLAVDERAVARAAIAQQEPAVVLDDLGVLARDVGADDLQVGGGAAADQELRPVEDDDPAAL